MDRVICIAVDLTGSEEQTEERLAGCVGAVLENEELCLTVLGNDKLIAGKLEALNIPENKIRLINVTHDIGKSDAPVQAVCDRRDSALVKGLTLVKNGEAGAFLSAAPITALNTGAQMILGRIDRLQNVPNAALINGYEKQILFIDSGATGRNIRPFDLVMFARMGAHYMRYITGTDKPLVGLISDDPTPTNGDLLYRDGFELLKRCRDYTFAGTVSPRSILHGKADVVVCDGFSGGLVLDMLSGMISDHLEFEKEKTGRIIFGRSKRAWEKELLDTMDIDKNKVVFLPGIRGNVLNIRERCDRNTLKQAIGYAGCFIKADIVGRLIGLLRL
ncbi:MAG: hypothetical protein K6F93_02775 [Lachnospiraceae bacterium]|nr:hypothetical protein [Lachnospiraceae bacterium]